MRTKYISSITRHIYYFLAISMLFSISSTVSALDSSMEEHYELKLLGKYLFFDNISIPTRQSCATCHTPDAGWTNGTSGINQHQVAVTGANPHTVGTLKPPSNAYASLVPDFELDTRRGGRGGNFWNGRAKGDEVADLNVLEPGLYEYAVYLGPTADQAFASPFINPVEQGVSDRVAVCELVKSRKYAPLYRIAFNGAPLDCDQANTIFARFAVALSAYQHSKEVNAFDSKRDRAIRAELDLYGGATFPLEGLTDQENQGHDIFYNTTSELNPDPDGEDGPLRAPRGNCATLCHTTRNFNIRDGTELFERYTNDGYQNIGTPRNPEIPGNPDPDPGLQATSGDDSDLGRHKIPTLRNVDKRRGPGFKKAYTHNGWFKSLESLVHFYNTSTIGSATAENFGVTRCPPTVVTEREALSLNCWPEPEFDGNIFGFFVGNLRLTLEDEAALVAYMKTLSDIPTPRAPKPFNLRKFEQGNFQE